MIDYFTILMIIIFVGIIIGFVSESFTLPTFVMILLVIITIPLYMGYQREDAAQFCISKGMKITDYNYFNVMVECNSTQIYERHCASNYTKDKWGNTLKDIEVCNYREKYE